MEEHDRNGVSQLISGKETNDSRSNTLFLHFIPHSIPFLFLVQIVFTRISFSTTASSSLNWENDTSYPFPVGLLVALVGQDHCIYVFGGQNGTDVVSNSYKYSTTVGSPREWIEITSMPTVLYAATGCVANDGRFFIFGGLETNNSYPSFIQIYNTTDNNWNTISPNMPSGASIEDYMMSCAIDSSSGLMYITGGVNNGKRFYSYNISSNTITNLAISSSPTPFNSAGQGSFVVNGNLYVFGGGDYNKLLSFASTYIYDIGNNSWSTGENMTQSTALFGYATDGNRFYAIGGLDAFGNYLNYTQVYNISSGIWSVNNGTVYSEGLFVNSAVFLDDSFHSIGGGIIVGVSIKAFSIHRIASLCGVYMFSGPCDDLNQCTVNDTCHSNGTCIGIPNVTCPTPLNECQSNTCNSFWGCDVSSGTSCSSSNKCLLNTTCNDGECTGQIKACSNSNCNNMTGECVNNTSFHSLSSGDIAGIVIGLLFFIVIIAMAFVIRLKYKRRQRFEQIDSNSVQLAPYGSNGMVLIGNRTLNYSLTGNSFVNTGSISFPSISYSKNSYVLQLSKIEIKKKIGEGAFGCVYLGVLNRTEVAVKKLSKTNSTTEDIKEFMAEAELMKNLPVHPNVILFRGVTLPPDPLTIVTDFCDGGSLSEYLTNNPKIPISEKLQFIKDIAKGMLHLHCGIPGKEIIHRDLAARNILLRNGIAVITDFGLSRVKSSADDYQRTENNVGPLKWMSPESLYERKYSTKSDVFSFAVVIYEIVAQEPPWKDLNPVEATGKVKDGHRMVLPENCDCPLALEELMIRCWAQLPEDRPDFEEICESLVEMNR